MRNKDKDRASGKILSVRTTTLGDHEAVIDCDGERLLVIFAYGPRPEVGETRSFSLSAARKRTARGGE